MEYGVIIKNQAILDTMFKIAKESKYTVCDLYEEEGVVGGWTMFIFNPKGSGTQLDAHIAGANDSYSPEEMVSLDKMIELISKSCSSGLVTLQLTKEYTATIMDKYVEVGCQKIYFDKVLRLAELVKEKQLKK